MLMTRASLVDVVVDRLVDRIASGEFPPGTALPAEDELAAQSGASRLTVREAVKVLAAQQVLRPVQGRGTYVNPVDRWIALDAIMRLRGSTFRTSMIQLIEVRSMIEVGAAELFAPRCSPETLDLMAADLERMRAGHARTDVTMFVDGDIAFHRRILEGCGNPFVPATFGPIQRALHLARVQTSSVSEIRRHAIAEHEKVLTALQTGSSQAVGAAMRSHLDQTTRDALQYLEPEPATA
jgi:DNA-binding FadR family transcriptional regulator